MTKKNDYVRHRETMDRVRAQRAEQLKRKAQIKRLRSRTGAATDPWIQAQIVQLESK
jgi:hypothetical protein